MPPRERHTNMDVLRVFRLCTRKEQEACHAKLRDDISEFVIFFELQCDALSIALYALQRRTAIPPERGQPFSNNISSSYPTLDESCADKTNPYLLGNDFGFREFRHKRNPRHAVSPIGIVAE